MRASTLLIILIIKALLMLLFIWAGPIGLGPDEAQYWTWSQELDWGYYSKPPAIAWEIWLGTSVFGNNEVGVRFGAVVLAVLLPFAVYLLGKRATGSDEIGFWAAVGLALSPLGMLSSIFAITDTGMALFWVVACWEIIRRTPPRYLMVGFWIACGALFKWPIFALWPLIGVMIYLRPEMKSKGFFGGVAVSLLGLLPSLYWNWSHDWATVRHVFATIVGQQLHGGTASIANQGNFFDFLGAQALLMSPVLFVLFCAGCWIALKEWKKLRLEIQFVLLATLGILGICLTMALFKKMQGNWASYVYGGAFVMAAWFCRSRSRLWYIVGVAVALVLSVMVLIVPWLQENGGPIPYKWSPFKHNVGWKQLENSLSEVGYNPDEMILFGDKYQMTSILSFYSPGQKRAYFLNLRGARKNQFNYWPGMQTGENGLFVQVENGPNLQDKLDAHATFYNEELQKYFDSVVFEGIKPLFISGDMIEKAALIYRCTHYNGNEPTETQLY